MVLDFAQPPFDQLPVPLWVEDHSAVRQRLQKWRHDGVSDLSAHLAAEPHRRRRLAGLVRVVEANQALFDRYGYSDLVSLRANLAALRTQSAVDESVRFSLELESGGVATAGEAVNRTAGGRYVPILVSRRVAVGFEGSWERVYCSEADISRRKRAERALLVQRDVALALGKATGLEEAFGDLIKALRGLDGIDAGMIYAREAGSDRFRMAAWSGISEAFARVACDVRMDDERTSALVAAGGAYGSFAAVCAAMAGRCQPPKLDSDRLQASVALPICRNGRVLAVLLLSSKEFEEFWPATRQAIEAAAAETGNLLARIDAQQELAESVRHMRALLTSSRAMNSTLDYGQVLHEIARWAGETLDVESSTTWEYLPETKQMAFRALWQRHPDPAALEKLADARLSSDDPLNQERHVGKDLVVQCVSDPDLPPVVRAEMTRLGMKTWMFVPLHTKGEQLGVMVIAEAHRERHFTQAECEFARALGDQASMAMYNAKLHRGVEAQFAMRRDLLDLSQSLLSATDGQGIVDRLAEALKSLVDYSSLSVMEADEQADELVVSFASGADAQALRGRRFPLRSGVTGDVLRRGRAELVNDMLGDPRAVRVPQTKPEAQASIIVPMSPGARRAVLIVDRLGEDAHFGPDDLETVRLFAGLAAVAFENARLFQLVERQAIIDGLTGLYNHRHFYERLDLEFARAQRSGEPLSLLMLDLDDFKTFNDQYGHPAGDRILQTVAGVLEACTRHGVDLAARYGGEEFVVLLPGQTTTRGVDVANGLPECSEGQAEEVAERIRRAVGRTALGDVLAVANEATQQPHLTVSVGAASWPASAGTPAELVAQADAALYLAKHKGKNRVEVFDRS